MRNDLRERAERFANATCYTNNSNYKLYFSTTAPDARYKNYRYFFKCLNTHTVAHAFKTQKELADFLDGTERLGF